MDTTKAEILTQVNKNCKRAETDIDDILLAAMREISIRTGILTTVATGSTTAGQAYISAPTDLAANLIYSLYLGDDKPLDRITWKQYLNNNFGGWCLYKKRIYLRPNPTSARTYTLEYSQIDDDVAAIGLPDEYEPTLVELTCAKLYRKYEMFDKIEPAIVLYERELMMVFDDATDPVMEVNSIESTLR